MNWVDGLQNHARVRDVLGRRDNVHILHGHTHRASDRPLLDEREDRVFCTTAVVEGSSPLRIYDVHRGRLVSQARSADLPLGAGPFPAALRAVRRG